MLKPLLSAQAGLLRDVDERALAGVLKQAILAHGGDEDIGKAIVIVIRNGHAHAVHFHRQPGALGDIGEGAVAIVAIQAQRGPPSLMARPSPHPFTSRISSQPSPS